MTADTYTKTGNKASAPVKLDKVVFGASDINHQLLKEAYLAYLANRRENFARTKRRGEVRGGGRKPWRQKGTGRARFGSSRNPIWTGGGVAFGPTGQENYRLRLSAKAKQKALVQALSVSVKENRLKVIDSFDFSSGKVKPVLALLKKIKADGSVLLVVEQKDESSVHATGNLPQVKLAQVNYLTVFDVLNADTIVASKEAMETLTARLSSKSSKTPAKAASGGAS